MVLRITKEVALGLPGHPDDSRFPQLPLLNRVNSGLPLPGYVTVTPRVKPGTNRWGFWCHENMDGYDCSGGQQEVKEKLFICTVRMHWRKDTPFR